MYFYFSFSFSFNLPDERNSTTLFNTQHNHFIIYLFIYSEFFICWVEVSTPLFNSLHKIIFANIKNIKNHLIFFFLCWVKAIAHFSSLISIFILFIYYSFYQLGEINSAPLLKNLYNNVTINN